MMKKCYQTFELKSLAWLAIQGQDTPWTAELLELMCRDELLDLINEYKPELLKEV
jgi:hypothetical protein